MTRRTETKAAFRVAAAILIGTAGCSTESGSPAPDTGAGTASEHSAKDANPEAANVTIRPADPQQLQQLLDEYRQQNKVVLIDFWATWCVPCREAFPKTVALSREHADDGLAVVSFAFEDDPQNPEQALAFLKEQQATFTNLVSALGGDQDAFDAFNVTGVPHYRVYGRDGELVKAFDLDPENPFDESDVEAAVLAALRDKPGNVGTSSSRR